VIARFVGDSHFPAPVWAAAQRERNAVQEAWQTARIPALEADLSQSLAQRFG
jgi:hypothetical protein